jgi:hypothetical protein
MFKFYSLKNASNNLILRKTICMYSSRPFFPQTSLQKMWEPYISWSEEGLGSPKRFHKIKGASI